MSHHHGFDNGDIFNLIGVTLVYTCEMTLLLGHLVLLLHELKFS